MRAILNRLFTVTLVLLPWSVLPAHAQTTIALSALGSYQSSTSNSVTRQVRSRRAGLMAELRHISNPLVGYDISYSFRGADQLYEYQGPTCVGSSCPPSGQPVNAYAQELAFNWVVSLPVRHLVVFALAGGGFEKFDPTNSQAGGTRSQTEGVFDYGAGFDWNLLPHLGLRFQYRGNVYKAPALATAFSSTDQFTHEAEPVVGAYFKF